MIQVPLDKIIPIEEALLDIGKVFDTVKAQKSLYVITKEGKPHSAIIDIELLEHLPEMENAGESKPIHEIGANNSYEGIKVDTGVAPPQATPAQPQATAPTAPAQPEQTASLDPTAQKAQEEMKDVLSDEIGPWNNEQKADGNPPDLDI